MGALAIGQNLSPIVPKEIYIIAPYGKRARINVKISTTPMKVAHSSGAPSVTVPVKLKDKDAYQNGESIWIDPDSAGGTSGDGKAVTAAVAATGLTGLGNLCRWRNHRGNT
jgi:hypothetical protein